LVAHFGNGDEDDQDVVREYAQRFGKIASITIFPGIGYGHMEFESIESGEILIKDLDSDNIKILSASGGRKER
jgi:hypothetical protein